MQMYHKIARVNQTVSSIPLAPWLEGFMKVHGQEQAMKFLSNVGVVNEMGGGCYAHLKDIVLA